PGSPGSRRGAKRRAPSSPGASRRGVPRAAGARRPWSPRAGGCRGEPWRRVTAAAGKVTRVTEAVQTGAGRPCDSLTGRSMAAVLLHALFFASGAAGLIYEVVWVRQFATVFGSTVYSV